MEGCNGGTSKSPEPDDCCVPASLAGWGVITGFPGTCESRQAAVTARAAVLAELPGWQP